MISATFKYRAGGYPYPTYHGEGQVSINHDETSHDEKVDALRSAAKRKVAKEMCMSLAMIEITDLDVSF